MSPGTVREIGHVARDSGGGGVGSGGGGSRRQRQRRELLAEIAAATRELVVTDGVQAVTLAAIAERVGVTAPALYRYISGRHDALALACAVVARELTQTLRDIRAAAGPEPLAQVLAICRTFRTWALARPAEFGLVFSVPQQALNANPDTDDETVVAALEFAWLFEETMLRLWARHRFAANDGDLPEALRADLTPYRDRLLARARARGLDVGELPVAATVVLLQYWTRIFGQISMEVYGHLAHATDRGEPLFEATLADLGGLVDADNPER